MTKPNTRCSICKKEIYRRPSCILNNNFCSYVCRNKFYSGLKSFAWKGNNYRKLIELIYNIKLSKNDIIHHKDNNHKNNSINNLMITTIKEHNKIHHTGKLRNSVIVICLNCDKNFIICFAHFLRGNGKYCSNECRNKHWKGVKPNERKKYKTIIKKISKNL